MLAFAQHRVEHLPCMERTGVRTNIDMFFFSDRNLTDSPTFATLATDQARQANLMSRTVGRGDQRPGGWVSSPEPLVATTSGRGGRKKTKRNSKQTRATGRHGSRDQNPINCIFCLLMAISEPIAP